MDFLSLASWCLGIYAVIQFIRFILADADLTVLWIEWFGKKPTVLSGQVVWITGSSSGIGEYLAYQLAKVGCKLVLSARRASELERVKKKCVDVYGCKPEEILVLPIDMEKTDDHPEAVEVVLKYFKKIDVLVNNAGRSQRAILAEVPLEIDRQMFEINFFGTISLTKCVLPHMLERNQGHIVCTSSTAGKLGAPLLSTYCGTKHALQGFFDCLRYEVHDKNIHVTMVCPGPVESNILKYAFTETPGKDLGLSQHVMDKRIATDRCTWLIAVAIANKIDEIWIAYHPVLFFMYVAQYCPVIAKRLGRIVGKDRVAKFKAKIENLH